MNTFLGFGFKIFFCKFVSTFRRSDLKISAQIRPIFFSIPKVNVSFFEIAKFDIVMLNEDEILSEFRDKFQKMKNIDIRRLIWQTLRTQY